MGDLVDNLVGGVIVLAILLGVVLAILSCFADIGFDAGYGEHIGYIGEIEETGIFWNPMNVKVLSAVPTMSQVDTVWHYGMKKELRELALNYSKSKTLVQVKYTTERFVWRWEYYNRDIIVDIKPAT